MTVVKGSKQQNLRVVPHRPWLRVLYVFITVLITASAAVGAYYFGFKQGMAEQEAALAQISSLSSELDSKSAALRAAEQELANIRLGAEVDRQSSEDVRQELIALKEQLAALEADNSFYRNLMAPTENKRGLTFGAIELSDTDSGRTYHYKFVMQQLATNHELLNGSLEVVVVGKQNDLEARYYLSDLSSSVSDKTVKLRFKYFQTIEGDLVLPVGFDPERIELTARSTGKNAVTIEKRFGWLVEET